jgi:ADP-ribosylglycohydrolase
VLHAVNHGGDSDSTGAICGNLLGASAGAEAIDHDLLAQLEGRDTVTQVTDDLALPSLMVVCCHMLALIC